MHRRWLHHPRDQVLCPSWLLQRGELTLGRHYRAPRLPIQPLAPPCCCSLFVRCLLWSTIWSWSSLEIRSNRWLWVSALCYSQIQSVWGWWLPCLTNPSSSSCDGRLSCDHIARNGTCCLLPARLAWCTYPRLLRSFSCSWCPEWSRKKLHLSHQGRDIPTPATLSRCRSFHRLSSSRSYAHQHS